MDSQLKVEQFTMMELQKYRVEQRHLLRITHLINMVEVSIIMEVY